MIKTPKHAHALCVSLNFIGGSASFSIPVEKDIPIERAKERFVEEVFSVDAGALRIVDAQGLERVIRCAHVTYLTFNR